MEARVDRPAAVARLLDDLDALERAYSRGHMHTCFVDPSTHALLTHSVWARNDATRSAGA